MKIRIRSARGLWATLGLFGVSMIVGVPAAMADSGPKVTTNYSGLKVESADGRFDFRVGGRIQADWNVFDKDVTPLGDGLEMRRARLKGQGKLYEDFKYKLEVNFDPDGKAAITDGWMSYNGFKPLGSPLILTFGHQKVPFSQQSMTSSNWQVFQERSMQDGFIDNPATGRRRLGFVARSYGKRWLASAGVFGEGVDYPSQADENFGTASRLLFYPLAEKRKLLTVGGAVYYRKWRRDNELKFGARPEAHISGAKLVSTGDLTNVEDMIMYNLQVSGVLGSFHAQGEYTGSNIQRRGPAGDLTLGGWYVQAGYFLTGENRNYDWKSGKYKRVTPNSMVGDGGFGAWEIAARYSEMDLSSQEIQGGEERNVTLGLNWWLNRSLMMRLNYVYAKTDPTTSEGGAAITGAGRDESINIIEGRFQVVF
ncbi:OprO/OprP family phosphate-selective porin [Myxococcota bacterium]|nr:OprO/OprP family phosphate-selective porin [Myxococcota bacterium]